MTNTTQNNAGVYLPNNIAPVLISEDYGNLPMEKNNIDARKRLNTWFLPGQSVDSALNQNKSELGILVLPVSLQMLSDGHCLLDQIVAVLWQSWGHSLALQDTQDLVTSDESDLKTENYSVFAHITLDL